MLQDCAEVVFPRVRRASQGSAAIRISIENRHRVSCDADLAALVEGTEAGALLPKSSANRLSLDWVGLKDNPLRRTVVLIEAAGRQHNVAASRFIRLMRSADWTGEIGENAVN